MYKYKKYIFVEYILHKYYILQTRIYKMKKNPCFRGRYGGAYMKFLSNMNFWLRYSILCFMIHYLYVDRFIPKFYKFNKLKPNVLITDSCFLSFSYSLNKNVSYQDKSKNVLTLWRVSKVIAECQSRCQFKPETTYTLNSKRQFTHKKMNKITQVISSNSHK